MISYRLIAAISTGPLTNLYQVVGSNLARNHCTAPGRLPGKREKLKSLPFCLLLVPFSAKLMKPKKHMHLSTFLKFHENIKSCFGGHCQEKILVFFSHLGSLISHEQSNNF